MAWVSKFSGLPTQTTIPEPTDAYSAGQFTIGSGFAVQRDWNTAIIAPAAYGSPKAYETLASIGANIAQVLRVTARLTGLTDIYDQPMGAGLALYGPGNDDAVLEVMWAGAWFTSPNNGQIDGFAEENGTSTLVSTDVIIAQAPPYQMRVYWNGTGSAFIIPDAGFGSWSVAANTVSYWNSNDDGVTWNRLGDRAIAGGVAPDKVGLWALASQGPGVNMTFSNLEVMQEGAADVTAPVVQNVDPADGEDNVDPHRRLYAEIVDPDTGVDASTVVLTVNGVVAWTGDAAQSGFSVTKTAITNGFSYLIIVDEELPVGINTLRVQGDDNATTPNSADVTTTFFVPTAEQTQPDRGLKTWYRNDFDGTKETIVFEPYGTVQQTGGVLRLTLGAGESGDRFYNNLFEVPYMSVRFGNQPAEILQFESQLAAFSGSTVYRIAGMALMDSRNPDHSYYQFYYREDNDQFRVERGIRGAGHVGLANTGDVGTFNGQYRFRVIVDRVDHTIQFWYSTNNGSSWGQLLNQATDFEPDQVILYIRQFSNNPSITADFAFLEVQVGDHALHRHSPARGTVAGADDDMAFPELVGPKQYVQEFGVGVRLPGPPDQQAGSIGPFEYLGVQDEVTHSAIGGVTETQAEPGILTRPLYDRQVAEVDDAVSVVLSVEADYSDFKQDGDGNYFLGGQNIQYVARFDTTAGSFGNPTVDNHWGAARNGKNYANGEECAPGGFGTLAGGFNSKAWRIDGVDPIGRPHPSSGTVVHQADDTIRFSGLRYSWTTVSFVMSANRWVLTGDFDIEISWSGYSTTGINTSFEFFVRKNSGGSFRGVDQVYIYRHGNGNIYAAYIINGAWTQLGIVATAATSGKFRFTRTSNSYQCYYDIGGGWVALGGTISNVNLNDDVFVGFAANGDSGHNVTGDMHGFTINSGATTNLANWAREASGTHRGTRADMPTDLGVICTQDSMDLIDRTSNKLWMRFVSAANNVLHQPNPAKAHKVVFDNGLLFVAFGRRPTDAEEGSAILIDFAMNMIRVHREVASTITGGWYGGTSEWEPGPLPDRNAARNFGGDYTEWQIQDYRVYDVDVWRDSGYEYRAIATLEGLTITKVEYQHLADNNWGEPDRSASTESGHMRGCLIDPANGELLYTDGTNLYGRDKTTWEGVMPTTQSFSAGTTKPLSGTRWDDRQYRFIKIGSNIYMPANEGVYMINWPSGSFALEYGKPGSGAAHEILPNYGRVNAIAYALDGLTNVLVCALDGNVTPLAVINLDTDALHGIAPLETGKSPLTVAAF